MNIILRLLNRIIDLVGWVCVIALLLMIVNVFINVFVRYIVIDVVKYFDAYLLYDQYFSWLGGIGMQELEWHFFSVTFLLGLSYTLRENGHVRVDIFYENFNRKTKAWLHIMGTLIFIIPFSLLVVYYGWDFFIQSFNSQENKGDPGSLPRLWPIKFTIPLSFMLLLISAVAVILREYLVLTDKGVDDRKGVIP